MPLAEQEVDRDVDRDVDIAHRSQVLLDAVRAAWPPTDSGAGPATGREDLDGTVVLDVLDLGRAGSRRAAIAVAELPGVSRVQAIPLIEDPTGWRRADAGDGVSTLLVARLGSEPAGSLAVRSWGRPEGETEGERAITGDQTNESVVVGDAAVVKWLRPVPEDTSRALTLTAHLAAVGFTGTPRPLGVLVWRPPSGAEVALAHVDGFLRGAVDGYTWCVDDLLAHLEDCPPGCVAAGPRCRAWFGADLGALTAGLHTALATPSTILPEPVGEETARGLVRRADGALDGALAAARGETSTWLSSHAEQLRRAFRTLPGDGAVLVAPVHGDLHVGQVLRWDGGLALIDFDGNPTLGEQQLAEPPARDAAQMTCSIDHVGRIAGRRTEGRHRIRVEEWIVHSRASFLAGYTGALAGQGRSALFDDRLLGGFEVEQECRELIYAARYLPRWAYAPVGALAARFGED